MDNETRFKLGEILVQANRKEDVVHVGILGSLLGDLQFDWLYDPAKTGESGISNNYIWEWAKTAPLHFYGYSTQEIENFINGYNNNTTKN